MADKRINIFGLLKNEGKLSKVLVYPGIETENDPVEHTTDISMLNPVPINALIQQISFEALRWKYFGQIPQDSIQILCELKHENLLKLADKIKVNNNYYGVYKDSSKSFMILKRTDYLVVILERKNL